MSFLLDSNSQEIRRALSYHSSWEVATRMAEKPTEKLKLADGTVSLQRDIQLKYSPTETGVGDHMIVQHVTGTEENVIIIKTAGKPRVKRLAMHMDVAPSTPAVPSLTAVSHSLEDVDQDDEKRLLAIYDMFPKQAA
jgi:hypothetical protein